MQFTNILFPVDLSERCRIAAPFVRAVTRHRGAVLNLASFVHIPAMWYGTAEAPCITDMGISRMLEETQQSLESFTREFFPDVQTKLLVEEGDPGSCVAEMARAWGIDLIMMPTRGCGRFRAALLGSVTAKVLHDTECPVWTAAHADQPGYSVSTEWNRVVCAIDTTPDALCLIRRASEIASANNAAVQLVHALPPQTATRPEVYLNRDFEAFLKDSARQAIAAMQTEAGTDFKVRIEAGSISSVVAEAAEEDNADLVLAGRGTLSHFAGRLRTHVYAIIRDSPCPVLSF